ncbi:MAG: molybdopterin dinucleotide binding domain-containing protein, partial [Notoacmeibacter sp.]
GEPTKETRFFAGGNFFMVEKKARAVAVSAPVKPEQALPYILNTGRVRDHWHTMTRTGKSAKLSAHLAEPFCEIHPDDARQAGVFDAGLVTLSNAKGRVVLRAMISERQRKGTVFAPMHWSDQNAANARIDTLVEARVDPVSGQPALKATSVAMLPFKPALYGFAVSSQEPKHHDLPYSAKAIANNGWRLEFALGTMPDDVEAQLKQMLGVNESAELIAYHDNALGHQRFAFFEGDQLLAAAFLSPEPVTVSRSATVAELARQFSNRRQRFSVIASRPRSDMPDPGPQICACFSIGANHIAAAIEGGCSSVEAIGKATSAGTNCGSCKSEIRSLLTANSLKDSEHHDHRVLAAE